MSNVLAAAITAATLTFSGAGAVTTSVAPNPVPSPKPAATAPAHAKRTAPLTPAQYQDLGKRLVKAGYPVKDGWVIVETNRGTLHIPVTPTAKAPKTGPQNIRPGFDWHGPYIALNQLDVLAIEYGGAPFAVLFGVCYVDSSGVLCDAVRAMVDSLVPRVWAVGWCPISEMRIYPFMRVFDGCY